MEGNNLEDSSHQSSDSNDDGLRDSDYQDSDDNYASSFDSNDISSTEDGSEWEDEEDGICSPRNDMEIVPSSNASNQSIDSNRDEDDTSSLASGQGDAEIDGDFTEIEGLTSTEQVKRCAEDASTFDILQNNSMTILNTLIERLVSGALSLEHRSTRSQLSFPGVGCKRK